MKRSERQLITRLRLSNQLLDRSPARSIPDVVRHVTALQAQDLLGAKWSLGLRMPHSTVSDVDAALASGTVVRSWPFRGTLHFVLGEDLGWMLDLTGARMVAAAAGRHRQLELDAATFERARDVTVGSLQGGRSLTRDELFTALDRSGISTAGQRGVHLLNNLSQTKTVCLGPMHGASQQIVLLDEWVSQPRVLSREASLAELALRYFTGHGPATARDMQWWSGLLAKDVAAGIALACDQLELLAIGDIAYWVAAGSLDGPPLPKSGAHLMPGFDEYLLGYTDRRAALDAEYSELIVPGANGMFLPNIVVDGRVVGAWKRRTTSTGVTLTAWFFENVPAVVRAAVRRGALQYAAYLGVPLASLTFVDE